jgi:acetamidase/formamidase
MAPQPTHTLESTLETTTDFFSAETRPILTVVPGASLRIHTLDCNGHLEPQQQPGQHMPVLIPGARGHCLVGPIEVEGAMPGQALAVHLTRMTPDDWGFTSAGKSDTPLNRRLGLTGHGHDHSASLLWKLDGSKGTNQLGLSVALAPFLGVIGMPPAPSGEHSTIPPRAFGGGNIDCRELVAGSTLYLPVTVPGALLSIGDGHAAQGDGEVSGTAIECGMTTDLTLDLVANPPLDGIHAITPAGYITFGFDADLNEASAAALEAMVAWMQELYSIAKAEALAMASVVVSMHVTQVANETWGVHAILPTDAIGAP